MIFDAEVGRRYSEKLAGKWRPYVGPNSNHKGSLVWSLIRNMSGAQ